MFLDVDLFAVRELGFHRFGQDGSSSETSDELQANFADVFAALMINQDAACDVPETFARSVRPSTPASSAGEFETLERA